MGSLQFSFNKSNYALAIGRLLFSALLLGLLVYLVNWKDLLSALAATRWSWLLVMYALTAIAVAANASLLLILLRVSGLDVTLKRVMLATCFSVFYALILPSDVIAGLAKWADLSAATGKKAPVLSAIIFAKITTTLPPLLLGTAALAFHNPLPGVPLATAGAVLTVAIFLLYIALLHPGMGQRLDRAAWGVIDRLPTAVRESARALISAIAGFRNMSVRSLVVILVLAAMQFGLGVAGFACALHAVGQSAPFSTLIWVNMTLFLTGLLPITFSNLGVREGLLIAVLGLYGIDPAVAMAVGLLLFTNVVSVAVFGAAYQIALSSGWISWDPR